MAETDPTCMFAVGVLPTCVMHSLRFSRHNLLRRRDAQLEWHARGGNPSCRAQTTGGQYLEYTSSVTARVAASYRCVAILHFRADLGQTPRGANSRKRSGASVREPSCGAVLLI